MEADFKKIIEMLESLTSKDQGCPWSSTQTTKSLCQYVVEEGHEVSDATSNGDNKELQEELGDLLFATLFTYFTAVKEYDLDSKEIIATIISKVKRRHPHVFENPRKMTFEELHVQWEQIKAKERQGKKVSPFKSISKSLPIVTRAIKLVELGYGNQFAYKLPENSFERRFIELIIDGTNAHVNLNGVFDQCLNDYQEKLEAHIKEKTGDVLTT